jgi:hypothetical protein
MSMSNTSPASTTPNNHRVLSDIKYSDSKKSHSRMSSYKENQNDSSLKLYK